MTALAVAREALEQIAERGVTRYSHLARGRAGKPDFRTYRCPACKELQGFSGSCANRECLAAIARAALDDMRRAS